MSSFVQASGREENGWSAVPQGKRAENWHMFEAVCGRAVIGLRALIVPLKIEAEIETHSGQDKNDMTSVRIQDAPG